MLVLMLADSTVLYARPKPENYIGKRLSGSHLFRQMLLHAGEEGTFPVSVILTDVDYLKRYNDKYGHVMGDECLKMIASTLSSLTQRRTDRVARYGGEEFAIILTGLDEAQAISMARRATDAVARLNIQHVLTGVPGLKVTLSAGCAIAHTRIGSDRLIKLADAALYRAKAGGRNQVCT